MGDLVDILKNPCRPHPPAHTHRHHAIAYIAALQFSDDGCGELGASAARWRPCAPALRTTKLRWRSIRSNSRSASRSTKPATWSLCPQLFEIQSLSRTWLQVGRRLSNASGRLTTRESELLGSRRHHILHLLRTYSALTILRSKEIFGGRFS